MILAIAAALNSFLPQGDIAPQIPQSQIPKWLIRLGQRGWNPGDLWDFGIHRDDPLAEDRIPGYLGREGNQ